MNCFFFFLEMVSVIENINTDNDNDDSDAPVEITTKTSKTKKKKNTKRRIKYTLATEDDDDRNDKHLDEESALTHLVFGDDDDYLEELTSGATKKLTVESKKPAWIDSEEVTEEMFVIFLRI